MRRSRTCDSVAPMRSASFTTTGGAAEGVVGAADVGGALDDVFVCVSTGFSSSGLATREMITAMSATASTDTMMMSGHIHGLRLELCSGMAAVVAGSVASSRRVVACVWP